MHQFQKKITNIKGRVMAAIEEVTTLRRGHAPVRSQNVEPPRTRSEARGSTIGLAALVLGAASAAEGVMPAMEDVE